jgi:hypothetical protein
MDNKQLSEFLDACIAGHDFLVSTHYYYKIEEKVGEISDEIDKARIKTLYNVCTISLANNDEENPYQPIYRNYGNGSRSADTEDITLEEIDWLLEFAMECPHEELKGKIHDISFIRTRNHQHGMLALKHYAESLNILLPHKNAYEAVPIVGRVVSLMRRFNQYDPIGKRTEAIIISFMENGFSLVEYPTSGALGICRPFLEVREANHSFFADLCVRIAHKLNGEGDFLGENELYDLSAAFYKKSKDSASNERMLLKAAEVFEKAAGFQTNPMQASNLLQRSIAGYRLVKGQKDKVDELHRRLLDVQGETLNYLGRVTSPKIDISTEVEWARAFVKREKFLDGVWRLSKLMPIPDFGKLKAKAIETIKNHPILFLFSSTNLDGRGRVTSSVDPALIDGALSEEKKSALWAEIVNKAQHHHQVYTQAFVIPAIQQVTDDHFLSEGQLIPLFRGNPFVEPGHEFLWAKAIICGLRFQWPEAASILIPQVENSLRFILENEGVLISKLDDGGTQEVLSLNFLLEHPKLKEILGNDLVTDFQILLTDKFGPNIRNRLAHGLIKHDEFFNSSIVYVWWLSLFMVLLPVNAGGEGPSQSENGKEG